ncbi:hypothetical protein N7532_010003 [Penicillium argentinense]|uniref:D-xylulose reductase n=1 Tax=Penicillium argentinense TaxID=1131581 RepID=A0A9W9JY25_9EURO|nr:uncharacterized protein N7532_010003 [Penicillium argentinense]KAJ5085232.1 hypothetical protein N7532_010003 [Penicillium argentinense]
MQNPSCLLYGPGDARFEDLPLPAIEDPLDVIIRIAYVGVCESDVHFWTHGGVGKFVSLERPLALGHEASGIVYAVGPAVMDLQPGDPVAIEPGYPCRLCSSCKVGKYNLCPKMKFAGSPPHTHGALSKYYKLPADCCYKIPTNTPTPLRLDEAVLIEPLAVAVHSVRQVRIQPGEKVVVFGAGTVGLLCAAVAREYGASMIISVDLSRDKLDFAHSIVPNGRVNFSTAIPNPSLSAEENAQCLRGMHRSSLFMDDVLGFDVAIESTGAESCIQVAIHSLRVGGSFVQTGLGKRNVSFPISTVSENEINVKGCFRYGPGDYKMALEFALTKKIGLKPFITKVVPFENAVEAWETAKRGEGIKTLIRGVGFSDGSEHTHTSLSPRRRSGSRERNEYIVIDEE